MEETKKQPDMAEGQRRPRGMGYYQRSKAEEFPAKASGPISMDTGKLEHPGGARSEGGAPHNQQQVVDPDLGEPWKMVEHEDLERIKVGLSFCPVSMIILLCCLLVGQKYIFPVHITTVEHY